MAMLLFLFVFMWSLVAYALSYQKSVRLSGGIPSRLHSRPNYHGFYSLLCVLIVGWGLLLLTGLASGIYIDHTVMAAIKAAKPGSAHIEYELILSDAKALATGALASRTDYIRVAMAHDFTALSQIRFWAMIVLVGGGAITVSCATYRQITLEWRARNRAETLIHGVLIVTAAIAVLTTVGIVLSLIFETFSFFSNINWRVDKFLFGTRWSPLSGVHDGALDPNKVGAIPLFAGTFLITLIAMLVAVPVGLFAAIYLSDFASKRVRSIVKPLLELLAGIPTVVYGFFAAITVAPFFRTSGEAFGIHIASESALAAGIVMGIMIIPFISSLSDDVINAVPQTLREGSYGLGATKAETIRHVVLPAALPGIVSAVLLGISRAVGETMIVVMAAGQGANLTANPFEAVTTVTVQIVMLITGDTEASTAAGPAFTLGFTLFCMTLLMNVFAQRLVHKYRERYD